MSFVFNRRKATQEAALLLSLAEGKKMPYLKLIKLMYIADRESIKEHGFPISGDAPFALKDGPILSDITNCVREVACPDEWTVHISTKDKDVELISDPGDDLLSRYEAAKLTEVFNRYKDYDQWKLRDLTHEFAEYIKNKPGKLSLRQSNPIPLSDIVEAVGRTADLREIERNRDEDEYFASLSRG